MITNKEFLVTSYPQIEFKRCFTPKASDYFDLFIKPHTEQLKTIPTSPIER